MFVEVNTGDAAERGIKDGHGSGCSAPRTRPRPGSRRSSPTGSAKASPACRSTSRGWYQGADLRDRYPQGTDPIVLGESVNTVTTYGYDPVTGMQEPKATLCQIRAA